jgi:hypothetical protein
MESNAHKGLKVWWNPNSCRANLGDTESLSELGSESEIATDPLRVWGGTRIVSQLLYVESSQGIGRWQSRKMQQQQQGGNPGSPRFPNPNTPNAPPQFSSYGTPGKLCFDLILVHKACVHITHDALHLPKAIVSEIVWILARVLIVLIVCCWAGHGIHMFNAIVLIICIYRENSERLRP